MTRKIENMVPKAAIWRQILVLIPVFLNVFVTGCTTGWMPIAIYFFNKGDEVSATPSEAALIVSSSELGRIMMAIPGGIIVDKFGRKPMIILIVFLHMLSWLTLSISASIPILCVARFILGTGVAFENSTGMMVIGELASPKMRAKLSAIYSQFWTLGTGFPIVLNIWCFSYFTLSYCTLAICALNFIFLYWASETPDYLISISKNEKALMNLEYVRRGYAKNEIISEFDKMKNYIEIENQRKLKGNWLQFVKSKDILRPILITSSINFFYMATGSYTFTAYVTLIVPENEFISKEHYALIMFIDNFIIVFLLPLYIEKFPRRILMLSGIIVLFSCLLFLSGTCFGFLEYQSYTCKWVFTIFFFITAMIFRGWVQPIVGMLRVEIIPQSVRGFGGSLCAISQALGNFTTVLVFNFMLNSFGLYYNFILYAVNCLILFFLAYNLVPECRGKFLADIQIEIKDNLK